MAEAGLGRRVPTDWEHYEKYPLTADTIPAPPTPVVIGVNWHVGFDAPALEQRPIRGRTGYEWWIKEDADKTPARGGHCVVIKPDALKDPMAWYHYYNQGREGACVGFGSSRMMSLLNRKRYDARWLWNQAKMIDEWADTNPGDDNGTSVRAAMKILKELGHVPVVRGKPAMHHKADEGIATYRWARTVDEMRAALTSPSHDRRDAFPILNSWGDGYPHKVWMPYTLMQRLIDADGEVALATDR